MLDYFDYLYVKIPLYGHLLRGIRYFIRIFANLYARYLMVGENINNTITNDTLIVSLTSYPARIKNVWMVVKTLLNQKEVNDFTIILGCHVNNSLMKWTPCLTILNVYAQTD